MGCDAPPPFCRLAPSPPVQARGRLWPSPVEGSLHNSISVLSQDQIDDLSPFAPPRWIPAYAGMTLVVQSTRRGREDIPYRSDPGIPCECGVRW